MTIGIMQPYFFPYIGYFCHIRSVDHFIILDDVQYIRRGWVNRNRIISEHDASYITLPVVSQSRASSIMDTRISEPDKHLPKMLKRIEREYASAPQFSRVFPIIEDLFQYGGDVLAEFNTNAITRICDVLSIKTVFSKSSSLGLKQSRKVDLMIDICSMLDSKRCINPIGGAAIYEKSDFEKRGVTIEFLRPVLRPYKQKTPGFVPGLSIVDVLMYNALDEVKSMLDDYVLE